jgi:cobalt/nickel transport protein
MVGWVPSSEITMRNHFFLAMLVPALAVNAASAHYHMLLPDKHSVKKDEAVTFTFQFGHPFEHQLFDTSKPRSLAVLAPDGKKTDLLSKLKEVELPGEEGKKVKGFQFSFAPDQRGDHVVVAESAPVWMEEDKEFFADVVKGVLHVQAQKGWEATILPGFEMVPLTRPYGLLPGMVFQAQVTTERRLFIGNPDPAYPLPAPGVLVEVERYHAKPPTELPPDELITRTVRTDPNGVATTSLTEPGWWCLTASRKVGMREHEGKNYPVRQRSTLWVHVDEKPAPK